jgi:hypothetical protein
MDSTGSRRFWAVECGGVANKDAYNVQELIDNRDQIWAEAVALYQSKEQWWLTEDEQQQSSEVNSKFDCVSIHEELIENWLCNNQGRTFTFEELSDEIYMETYEMADGTLGKRSKVIKLPTGGKWHKTILTSLGCLQLNNGNTARYKGRVGRFWVAPIENIPEIISVSQENYEVEFNADSTVKRVRKFGQEWVLLEDMSQEVREDWMKRYPKHETKIRNFPDKQERMFR